MEISQIFLEILPFIIVFAVSIITWWAIYLLKKRDIISNNTTGLGMIAFALMIAGTMSYKGRLGIYSLIIIYGLIVFGVIRFCIYLHNKRLTSKSRLQIY